MELNASELPGSEQEPQRSEPGLRGGEQGCPILGTTWRLNLLPSSRGRCPGMFSQAPQKDSVRGGTRTPLESDLYLLRRNPWCMEKLPSAGRATIQHCHHSTSLANSTKKTNTRAELGQTDPAHRLNRRQWRKWTRVRAVPHRTRQVHGMNHGRKGRKSQIHCQVCVTRDPLVEFLTNPDPDRASHAFYQAHPQEWLSKRGRRGGLQSLFSTSWYDRAKISVG